LHEKQPIFCHETATFEMSFLNINFRINRYMVAQISIVIAVFAISFLLCRAIAHGLVSSPYSHPSERSLHQYLIPRGGGLGIACGFFFGFVALGIDLRVCASLFLVWAVSALDDWISQRAIIRLSVQSIASVLLVALWLPNTTSITFLFLVLALIWCLNLFNFMDGADGIAVVTALIGATTLAIFMLVHSSAPMIFDEPIFVGAIVITAACLGFVAFNTPPAKMFMGDGGSTLLGLALAVLSIKGWHSGYWVLAVPIALFTPFWADATYTLLRRVLQGHSPFQAHRDNLYQRLVLSGLGHRGLLTWMICWNVISALVAFALLSNVSFSPLAKLLMSLGFGLAYVVIAHAAIKMPPTTLLLNPRALFALAYDLVAVAIAWSTLFWARFSFNLDDADYSARDLLRSLTYVIPVHAAAFILMGMYRGLWRFASLGDLWLIVRAAFVAAAAAALLFTIIRPDSFIWPRSVLALQPFLLIVLMGGARMGYRSWKEHRLYGLSAASGEPVIVLGAGTAGAKLVTELKTSAIWRAVALLDDDTTKHGAQLHSAPVVGTIDQLSDVAKRFGARHAIIAMPGAPHQARRRAVTIASNAGLSTLTVPAYDELLSENDPLTRLRAIELEDLLGRDPVTLDSDGLAKWFSNKTILVTGAGGSIGCELCNQIARFNPGRLVMLDISEFAAHAVSEQMLPRLGADRMETYVADVRDEKRMREVFANEKPNLIFHAAAYKHVPLTETVNAWEAVRNNVLGTMITAECAREFSAEKFVLVSTDKAVRASSIMGASKRLAELVCLSFEKTSTEFVGVRFGNVLGSNGSVIPKFRKQIEAGGPVTVTHKDMTRFFMSIPEAAQLVLQAGHIGEAGSLYVLDMGTPVKIVDLAHDLIRLAKGRSNAIPISYTGLRLGEKMHEELVGDNEKFVATRHEKVRRVISDDTQEIDRKLLQIWLNATPPADIRTALQRWVVDFKPPVL
jgi:FlaA1/EpsC-like NDP-sugar epimerase/UDP-N-acetylmuramyl pentapeptide phosphotransferase/UDP-N-acetylglucosamine-1-phosphate transferase